MIKKHKEISILLACAFIIHSVIALVPPLNGDEATFWEWSRHLAFGYYAHPPMTAWLVALTTGLFGVFKYCVRLPAILLHLGTCLIVYRIALDVLKQKKSAFIASLLYALLPVSFVLGTAMTTDAALIFCFALSIYFIRKAIIEERSLFWYATALSCGAMLLTKFMAVLFFPGILLFLIIHKPYRKWFLAKEPYIAALIALLIFSPFLYWNMQNNWLTFQFNLYMRHREEGFALIKPLIYLAGQLVAASPLVFVLLLTGLISFLVLMHRKAGTPVRDENTRFSFLLLSYVTAFPLVYFLAMAFSVEVAPHWPAVIYPAGCILLAAWLFGINRRNRTPDRFRKKLFLGSIVSTAVITVPICLLALFPKLAPDPMVYSEKVYGKAPVFSHFFGWEEIGRHVEKIKDEWDDRPEGLFFTSKDYSLASMLGFYTPSHPTYYLMNVTEEVVHGKSFLLWEKGKKKIGANTIYVSDTPNSYKTRLPDFFKEIEHLDPFVLRDNRGRILRVFYIAIGIHYLGGEPDNLSLW